jgi:protein phosphatase
MSYIAEYAVVCGKGKVRVANQDNFFINHSGNRLYLPNENDGLNEPVNGQVDTGALPAFAVFDGMGGENYGETAAYIAAETFGQAFCLETARLKERLKKKVIEPHSYLKEVSVTANDEICRHSLENKCGNMGTTMATVWFVNDTAYICNLGDSRVYLFRDGALTQASVDHSEGYSEKKKPKLTQYLGIDRAEFLIAPSTFEGKLKGGDRFVICSDGLTDMVSVEEMSEILGKNKTAACCADVLFNAALDNGGFDNVTVIVCDIKKTGWRIFK